MTDIEQNEIGRTLGEEYRKALGNLRAASEAIDNAKGVPKREAKIDFLIAQNNLLSIQLMMLMEQVGTRTCCCKGAGE